MPVSIDSLTTLATLPLPQAGTYVVWAKAYLTTPSGGGGVVTCRLVVGAGYDKSQAHVAEGAPRTLATKAHVGAHPGRRAALDPSMVDRSARRNRTYLYRPQLVGLDGGRRFVGTVSVRR